MALIKQSLDEWLDSVKYRDLASGSYIPSTFALEFMNFIKLVNGSVGESNKTPPVHLKMLDKLASPSQYIANLIFRGAAKTSLFMEYLTLYLAVVHELPNLGQVDGMIYIADSMENGAKSARKNIEFRFENSDFLKSQIIAHKFTDTYLEFTNLKGQKLGVKLFGATTGIRGTKIFGKRPVLCHVKGTTVFTDMGTHLVEDYYLKGPSRYLKGIDVYCAGFIHKETVTPEHRYFIGSTIKTRNKKYLENNKTKSITKLEYINPRWVEAKDISINKLLGHQQIQNDYICKKIDKTINPISQNVSKVLGIQITEKKSNEVFIKDGYIWRKIKEIKLSDKEQEFIPIQTPDHTYNTYFGISHNCVLDDLVSDEASKSKVVMDLIKDTVYKGVNHALDPTRRKVVFNGTPFNKNDILIEAVESGAWDVNVYPVCEKFPCEREEFSGAWEDRFTYDYISAQYKMAKQTGKLNSFYQELMLRIISEDSKLVHPNDLRWYKKSVLLQAKSFYNFYITTDFATSAKQSADYSVISVWAVNSNGDYFWVDGQCKRTTMNNSIDRLFELVSKYKPQSVGVEVTGQQGAFIQWLQKEMMQRNIFFNFASSGNNSAPGIRPVADKLSRFNLVVPSFKAGKFWFPEEDKDNPILKEGLQEINLATSDGLKGKDDFLDTISMLAYMKIWRPSESEPYINPENKTDLYDEDMLPIDTNTERMDSYIV